MPSVVSSSPSPDSRPERGYWLWTGVMLLAVSLALYATFAAVQYKWNWSGIWPYRQQFLTGWLATLGISLGAMIFSVLVGFLFMAGRRSPWQPVRILAGGMVEFLRGTPLLVQLLIGYYVIANALRINEPFLVGTLLLGFFEGAYLSEIFRGAVESISASQREAARAVGFSVAQTYRHVIIPQALRRALPGTTGQLVSLIKDSSRLSVIGIDELSYRRHHEYLTVVIDHRSGRVVWARKGKSIGVISTGAVKVAPSSVLRRAKTRA